VRVAESRGQTPHRIPGRDGMALIVTGSRSAEDAAAFLRLDGVADVRLLVSPYKLAARESKPNDTVVTIGGVTIGGPDFIVVAGPCTVESREQTLRIAGQARDAGAHLLRGGAFKPRTSPYAFQGLGEEGLKILAEAREATGLPFVTEALDCDGVDLVERYADAIQIGSRNMQNFPLLKRAGRARKPVLLKRGFQSTLEEFLSSAEYILAEGNFDLVLCERGIRTFSDFSRNTLDLTIVPAVKKLSHLPIIVDPSHASGRRDMILPLSRAAAAVGADGVMVETHDRPDSALCDGKQAIAPAALLELIRDVTAIRGVLAPPTRSREAFTSRREWAYS
jgi:3-deoxy-7-phosphoheptulonate synthase